MWEKAFVIESCVPPEAPRELSYRLTPGLERLNLIRVRKIGHTAKNRFPISANADRLCNEYSDFIMAIPLPGTLLEIRALAVNRLSLAVRRARPT